MSTDSRKLFTNTLIYTIGNFSAKILVFLLLPFYSFYLTKSELGIYDVVLTIVNFFVPIASLQISEAVYRWLLTSNDNINYEKKIISSAFFITGLSLAIFEFIYYIFNLYSSNDYYIYTIFLVVTSALVPFFQNVVRGLQKVKIYAQASVLQALLLVITNVFCLVILNLRLEAVFIANIIANICTIFYLFIWGKLSNHIHFGCISKNEIKNLLRYSLPLIPNSVSWWLVNAASKLIILYYLSTEFNGIYAVSSRFPTIIILFNSIFILAWQDHTILSKQTDETDKSFNSIIFDKFINFEISITLILISSSALFTRYLVSSDFYEAYKYMPFLYLGAAFSAFSGYFGAAYLKEKKTMGILVSSFLAGVLSVLISLLFIKKIGLMAPSLGVFISFLAMFLLRVYQTKRFFLIKINYIKLISLSLICLLFSSVILWSDNVQLSCFLMFLSVSIAFILNISVIKKMKTFLFNKIYHD